LVFIYSINEHKKGQFEPAGLGKLFAKLWKMRPYNHSNIQIFEIASFYKSSWYEFYRNVRGL
jgi:hypothetical protein